MPTPPLHDEGDACALDEQAMAARVAEVAKLYDRGLRRAARLDAETVELTFDSAVEPDVRDLVEREQACCAFFRFEVRHDADEVHLRASVPPAYRDYLEALLAGPANR